MGTFDAFQRLVWSPQFKQNCFPHRSKMGVLKSFLNGLFPRSVGFLAYDRLLEKGNFWERGVTIKRTHVVFRVFLRFNVLFLTRDEAMGRFFRTCSVNPGVLNGLICLHLNNGHWFVAGATCIGSIAIAAARSAGEDQFLSLDFASFLDRHDLSMVLCGR